MLFILAVVRMGGLVRQQAQSTLRERALREAGSALVTATGREQIFEATLRRRGRRPASAPSRGS